MKKGLLTAALAFTACLANAQSVTDTVSVGASYVNQVWYSLPNDNQGTRDLKEWDIAFDLKNITSGVMVNTVGGVTIWKYPKGNLANGWTNADTAGLSTWAARYNSDTSWAYGAIGRYADPNNSLNLDWGSYNMTTHTVAGDSLYIIKLANGTYKKFAIESLISGVYAFKYANLDNSSAQTLSITKTNYTGKNFAYVNLTSNTILDREPLAASWDLQFTQYTTFLGIPYGVTGVLQNQGVQAVKVAGLANKATYVNYSAQTFSTAINTIGYDWKSFTGTTYALKDSQLYFVKRANGDIWKMIFTGFGGSTTGNFIFSKEKIYSVPTGISAVNAAIASVTLYPNPARGQNVHVVYDLNETATGTSLTVYDLAGRIVHNTVLEGTAGLHQYELATGSFTAGTYIISLTTSNGRVQQKLIVQ